MTDDEDAGAGTLGLKPDPSARLPLAAVGTMRTSSWISKSSKFCILFSARFSSKICTHSFAVRLRGANAAKKFLIVVGLKSLMVAILGACLRRLTSSTANCGSGSPGATFFTYFCLSGQSLARCVLPQVQHGLSVIARRGLVHASLK